jgi:hypothetical protein
MKTLLHISIRNALVAGVLAVILLVVLFYIGRHPFMISPFLDFRILLFAIFIFFTLKEFRDYHQNGLLYFWQGLLGSFIVVVLTSVVAACGLWIFGMMEETFVPSYIDQMTAYLKTFSPEDLERAHIGKEAYERNLEALPTTNMPKLVITHFGQGMIIGFFISILFSVILRRTT